MTRLTWKKASASAAGRKRSSTSGSARTLHIGIVNLATMCIDYPDNEMLLDYANNLFEYQNIHVEMQHQNDKELERGQISLQHFFDGLLQESYRVKRDSNNELW